ncbi:DUF3791 domain-containing protein [Hallella mizrahii]|uniref:DUF3791 domain-containing protein n=1 Tax=Hallella mizrahii TaxID=2606637 RepID=A0A7K0KC83_9BACT|nr:DUF3791 domain-containing protein [Hallella mizrahii]MST83524.1 DUF3791 domain-containing protein [Hallella mizrahii]
MIKDNPYINKTILEMKFARIISLLAQRLNVPESKALRIFYETHVYQYMCDLEYHLHNMSDAYCVDEIMLELENA